MIFLNCGSWARYCRIPYWNYPCCKDRGASANINFLDNNRPKKTFDANPAKLFIKTQCYRKHHVASILTSWTQVRFKDYPKLHSDCQLPNFQPYRKNQYKDVRRTDWGMGDSKYGYTYVVSFFGFLCAAYAVKTNLYTYTMYMSAAADVLAMASIEVDIAKIEPGICLSLKWRGKPLFIKHRTPAEIDKEAVTPMSSLKDPQTPEQRMTNQQWLIVIGICTHLGCVPIPNSGDFVGGFYCPCHGSHYDNLGRARKGPAPTNLEVPPYKFISDTLVQVG